MVFLNHIISLLSSLSLYPVKTILPGFNMKIRLINIETYILILKGTDLFKGRKLFLITQGKSHLNKKKDGKI